MNKSKLKDKVTLITGGSRGMGAKIAEVFAQNGSKIIIVYRSDTIAALKIKKKLINLI